MVPGSACFQWDPASEVFPGSPDGRFDAARVPAGRYIVEVRGANRLAEPSVLGMVVRVDITPSIDPICTRGAALSPGTFTGRTTGVDAFRYACPIGYSTHISTDEAPERVHRIDVARRQRWRIRATAAERLRVALYDACDPADMWRACQDHFGTCRERTLDVILDPGDYFLAVEGRFVRDLDYTLDVQVEDVGVSCASARVVSESGTVTGDTRGRSDDFRGSTCGDGSGPDDVLELHVSTSGYLHVELDTATSFGGANLKLLAECGGEALDEHNTRLDADVVPGTYFVVVDGNTATDEGTYELDVVMPPP